MKNREKDEQSCGEDREQGKERRVRQGRGGKQKGEGETKKGMVRKEGEGSERESVEEVRVKEEGIENLLK